MTTRALRVFVHDDSVADGDVPEPVVGEVIPAMAIIVEHACDRSSAVLTGVVDWVRYESSEELLEMVIQWQGLGVLYRQYGWRSLLPVLGRDIMVEGIIQNIRGHEFESFGVPDIRREWIVTRVTHVGPDGYDVDVEPTGAVPVTTGRSSP